jgi:hypothetical protein
MAVDRVRPYFFEIDVGSDFVLGVFWAAFASCLVTSVRANFAVRVSQGGSYSACARRMRCEIYLTTSSLATCIRQSAYDSEVLSINQLRLDLRLWDICTHTLAEKGESISVAGACMSFGHASNGPDFVPDLSRNVNLFRLSALASSIR